MALRLGDHVIRGEIFNDKPYSTHGWIELEGEETPLIFELTGDCLPDLKGKHVYFRANPEHDWEKPKPLDRALAKILHWHQIGPTGTITADSWVRAIPCPTEEFITRARLGEPPPTTWKRHFYMEWYSQNGRVVIELAGAIVETCVRPPDRKREDDDGEWEPLPMTTPEPQPDEDRVENDLPAPSPDVTILHREGDRFHVERKHLPTDDDADPAADAAAHSMPADLQRILDAAALETDRRAGIRTPDDDFIAEQQLMDDLMESGDGTRLLFFLQHPDRLPDPEKLNDRQIEIVFKSLLAELALHNIAIHVCGHFTPRDAYRLLLDKILIEDRAHPEIRGTGWVQGFMTSEYCKTCEEEAEREYNEMNDRIRKTQENPPNDSPPQ